MKADIGIIGGSGFYDFLKGKEISVGTPYGKPSDKILISEYEGRKIAFLPRHGKKHQFPPHKINYLANLYAFKKLGVKQILSASAVGSLKPKIKPGDFVICDQFINNAHGRPDTFFNGKTSKKPKGKTAHVSTAEPYCQNLRKVAAKACSDLTIPFHKNGTAIIIQGPRFSTKAESIFWSKHADIINMTQYPEVALARELEMCYLNISLVTDYDAGLQSRKDIKPVTFQEVAKIFAENNEKIKKLFQEIIKQIDTQKTCVCHTALKDAIL